MPRRRLRRKLSMTSLIDVIFLLLLFFMLSSTFSHFAEVDLLTGAGGGGQAETKLVFMQLSSEILRVNGQEQALDMVVRHLEQAEGQHAALISLQGGVSAQRLTDLLVALRGVPGLQVTVLGQS